MQALDETLTGTERITELVSRLKSFAHAGRHSGPISVQASLECALRIAESEMKNSIRVISNTGTDARVLSGRNDLIQVFVNILINAAYALRDATEKQELHVRVERPSDAEIIVEVRDTGQGISEEARDKMFEPFFTTKGPKSGTGLGLTISSRIIRRLGGSIEADNHPEGGARFRISLPVAPPGLGTPVEEPLHAPRREDASSRLRVLVIDDEPGIQRGLARLLDQHTVVTAADATEARELMNVDRFDVVLCDVKMPGETGVELYERLRSDGHRNLEAFVFMTGGGMPAELTTILEHDDRTLMTKPITLDTLSDVLKRFERGGSLS